MTILHLLKRSVLILLCLAGVSSAAIAQSVNQYSFSQSSGTYTPISGGTVHFTGTGTNLDDQTYSVTLPFTFTFNGTAYTQVYVSANGYVSFGSTDPGTGTRSAISSSTSGFGIAAAYSKDLSGTTAASTTCELRSQTLGSSPNRTFVAQWTNMSSYNTSTQNMNFQVRLNETTNTVDFVYGTMTATSSTTAQVGLRGTTNATYFTRSTSTDWTATTSGASNSSTVTLSSTVAPASGYTFTFTPPSGCNGTPTAGTASASVTSMQCPGTSSSLTLSGTTGATGLTFQWESSSDNVNFSTIVGATNNSYSASPTATTYYHCIVTCTASALSATSNSVSVTVTGPTPGNTLASVNPVCSGNTTALSLQTSTSGSAYQWQSSPDGTNWSNIAGATNSTYTATIIANTYYRNIVTCSTGGANTPSTAVLVNLSTNFYDCYCIGTTTNGCSSGDHITSVVVAGISNATGSCISGGSYSNYKSTTHAAMTGAISYSVTVHVANGGTEYAGMWIDYNQNGTFDATEYIALNLVSGTGSPDYTFTGTVVVPSTVANGTTGLRVRSSYNAATASNSACSNYSYGETEDYLVDLTAATPCGGFPSSPGNTISSVGALATSGTPFTLSLTNNQSTSGITYTWYVSTDGGANYSVVAGATDQTYTVTQSGNGTYMYYCDVKCTNSNKTSSSNAVTVATQIVYCVPTTTTGCTDGDVIARVVLNTLDHTTGTGCPSAVPNGSGGYTSYGGYSNYYDSTGTGLTTTLKPATTYGCTVYAGQYSEGYAAWIDYNNDGVFDNSTERIGYSAGQVTGSGSVGVLGSSATFPITLSCTPPAGQHRMRVRCMYAQNGVDVTPCTNNSYGEVEDYKITITAQANCAPGGVLTINGVGPDTAHLTWDPGCSTAPKWDFEYGAPGFVQGGGSGTVLANKVAAGDYTLTGLSPNTSYDVYYRARCGTGTGPGTGNSTWSLLPVSFTTLMAPCSGTPNADTAAGPAQACSGASFTVTSTGPAEANIGLSYQWQQSTDGGANWTDISGATNRTSVSTSLTASTMYRLATYCSYSTTYNYSNTVSVALNTAFYSCYCAASNQGSALIDEVQVRDQIVNTTASQPTGLPYYTPVHTADTFKIRQGASVPFSVTSSTAIASVWIDYNHDGVYSATEWQQVSLSFSGKMTIMLNVPDTAMLGLTGMRVRSRLSGNPNGSGDACLAMGSGETEDYLVNILAPCTKLPKTAGTIAPDTTLKVCGGETRTYTLPWAADADHYAWTAPTGGTITSGQGTNSVLVTFDAGFTGNDTLQAWSVNHCGNALLAKNYIVQWRGAPLTPGTISVDTTLKICPGEFRIYSIVANPLATSYTWAAPTGGSVTSGQGTTSATITYAAGFTATGNVTVTATNGCGTSAAKASIAYFRGAPKAPGTVTQNAVDKVCPGEARDFSILPVDFATSYAWTTPAATINSGQGTTSIHATFGASYIQDTMISVTSVNTCGSSAPKSFTVKRRGIPKTPLGITGDLGGVCAANGKPYSITGGAVAGTDSYNWSFNTGDATVATGQGTAAITANFAPAYLTGILSANAQNGCGVSLLSKSITIAAAPAKAVVSGSLSVCSNTGSSYTATTTGATSYTWGGPAGCTINDGSNHPSPYTTASSTVTVNFGATVGNVTCIASNACGAAAKTTYAVKNCLSAREESVVETDGLNVELVPNPATDQVTVRLNATEDSKATVRILSMTGQQMISMEMASTMHSQLIIPVNQLAAGMYMVEVTTADGQKQVKQLVKQ